MTLLECLVVLAVIFLLAGMLVPVRHGNGLGARMKVTQMDMQGIISAIQQYQSTYQRLPVSSNVSRAAAPDFTFGTYQAGFPPNLTPVPHAKGKAQIVNNHGIGYQAPNSEIMAILMDEIATPEGRPTVNTNHSLNPERHVFITPKMSGDTTSHGVGTDLVYRDPWGNPYIVTLDVNGDGKARDAFYSLRSVSSGNAIGLVQTIPGTDSFETSVTVMVWSLGPDGNADPASGASAGANKDNVLSWH